MSFSLSLQVSAGNNTVTTHSIYAIYKHCYLALKKWFSINTIFSGAYTFIRIVNLLIIYNDLNVLVFLQSKTGFWIVFECCLDRKSALKYEHYSSCFEKCQNKEHIKDRSLAGIKYNNSSEERDTSEHLVLTLHSHRQAQRHSYTFYLSFSSIIYVCLKQWS